MFYTTGQKESKPFVSPPTAWSGSLSQSLFRRNLDFQASEQAEGTAVPHIPQLGQFWHIAMGKQKLGQIFKREKKHQTLGSMVWESVLRAT